MFTKTRLVSAILAVSAGSPISAIAQETSDRPALEEVIVTALKGAAGTAVSDTPIAVSAFGV